MRQQGGGFSYRPTVVMTVSQSNGLSYLPVQLTRQIEFDP